VPELPRRASIAPALRRIGNQLLEEPDLDGLARLLTRVLPDVLGVPEVTLLLWDRKLDTFEALTTSETRRKAVRPEEAVRAPTTRYLLSGGEVIETAHAGPDSDGILVPLLARSGLVGMLVIGPRPRSRRAPLRSGEARILSDLASRAALALENHMYQHELIAHERMAALGTMAGMLAHDFRGPMTVIRGYAELLILGEAEPDAVRTRARQIVAMVDRLERMTRETLDFARGGARLVRRTVDAHAFVADLVAAVREEVPTLDIQCEVELPEGLQVALDVDKLRRVVANIGANARDAALGPPRLHLRAQLGPGDAAWLELTLRDEGPGMPAEIRERVFEPFVTYGKKGGTGLGLAVARRFVEDHGGSLELLPNAPGAQFRVRLPLTGATAATRT
jgi:signal transduction histidine kinase